MVKHRDELAEVTFTGESASGWQQVSLSNPVTVTAGTTYIASYYSNSGYFAFDSGYFTAGVDNYPLHALASGVSGPNGVYVYDASGFPTNGSSNNYWVDVVFTVSPGATTPPVVTSNTPANAATNVNPNTSISATFSKPLSTTTVNTATFTLVDATGSVIPATVTYNSSTSAATLQPDTALAYSARYTATLKGGSFRHPGHKQYSHDLGLCLVIHDHRSAANLPVQHLE